MIRACRAAGAPFAISAPGIAAATAALRSPDEKARSARASRARTERESLIDRLLAHGVEANGSEANFVLARSERSLWLRDALRSRAISTRAWPGSTDLSNALRITCPCESAAFERVTDAIDAALAPDALLLDLDGVIADVSRSYRAAILATCASFGVEATPGDIADVKARGDANNDWRVAQRILASRGVDAPYDLVVRRFEAIYQGGGSRPGLHETESLIGRRESSKPSQIGFRSRSSQGGRAPTPSASCGGSVSPDCSAPCCAWKTARSSPIRRPSDSRWNGLAHDARG